MSNEQVKYLKSLNAIRERSRKVYQKAESNALNHFLVDFSKLQSTVDLVNKLIKRDYESIDSIPPHGRWRHFDVGGKPRVHHLLEKWKNEGCQTREITRRLLDLFMVSVLLDAGAGNTWSYKEPSTGDIYNRSEGLAIASLDMFVSGTFSSSTSQPYQVDGILNYDHFSVILCILIFFIDAMIKIICAIFKKLLADKLIDINVDDVRLAFQVDESNPLEGLEGRANLLSRLGNALKNHVEFFKSEENSVCAIILSCKFDNILRDILFALYLWSYSRAYISSI